MKPLFYHAVLFLGNMVLIFLRRLKRYIWRKVRRVAVCVGQEVLATNIESFPSGSHDDKTCRCVGRGSALLRKKLWLLISSLMSTCAHVDIKFVRYGATPPNATE